MATNKAMKFHFAVFRSHEMPFMGYSQKIHGIFIKLWFIVYIAKEKVMMANQRCLPVNYANST